MNLLKGDPEKNDLLLRLSTFELSSLVPVIRIFKVFKTPDAEREVILELPFDTTAKGIESIFQNSVGRGTGAGVTSFQWKQNPKYEPQAASYRVNLGLHLQNVEEFTNIRNSVQTEDGQLLSVAIQDLLYQRKEWRQIKNEGTAVYNPDDYVIKVIVGWQISEEGLQSIKDNNTRADVDDLIQALRDQKDVLYLTLISHAIEFNEDGSIDLNIDFIGRTDLNSSDLSRSNVLTTGRAYENLIENAKKEIQNLEWQAKQTDEFLQENKEKYGDKVGAVVNFLGRVNMAASGDALVNNDDVQEAKKKLEQLVQASRKAKYNYLITKMLQKKQIHLFSYNEEVVDRITKLQGVTNLTDPVAMKDFEEARKKINEVNADIEKKAKQVGVGGTDNIGEAGPAGDTMFKPAREAAHDLNEMGSSPAAASSTVTRGANDQANFANKVANSDELAEKSDELYQLLQAGEFETNAYLASGRKHFAFFYLSSIVDAIMDPILDTNKKNPNFLNKKTRVILGPMTIIDYGSLQVSNSTYRIFDKVEGKEDDKPTYVKVYNGTPITINVGDVPISLREFTRWFNENIVNKNIDQMTLNDFLSSLVNDLILSALTNQVYTYAPKQKAKLAIDNFTAIPNPHNEGAFGVNMIKYKWNSEDWKRFKPTGGGFRIPQEALAPLKTRGRDAELDHDIKNKNFSHSKDYVVLYCINDSPYDRTGNYEKDKKEGVLHLYAGESRGTIRSLKFSRVDKPQRRAENILAGTKGGRGASKIIREKYNVTIEMFGNTSLQVGTYIFLTPTFTGQGGVGNTEKLLREIGLGGYYLVTEIDNTIELGDFKTTLKGTWSAFADGKINDGDREFAPAPPGAIPEKGVIQ
jgi:hypothetical protein